MDTGIPVTPYPPNVPAVIAEASRRAAIDQARIAGRAIGALKVVHSSVESWSAAEIRSYIDRTLADISRA